MVNAVAGKGAAALPETSVFVRAILYVAVVTFLFFHDRPPFLLRVLLPAHDSISRWIL